MFRRVIIVVVLVASLAETPPVYIAEDVWLESHNSSLVLGWQQDEKSESVEAYEIEIAIIESMINGVQPIEYDPVVIPRMNLFKYHYKFNNILYYPATNYRIGFNWNYINGSLDTHLKTDYKTVPVAPNVSVIDTSCSNRCHFSFNVTGAQISNSYLYVIANETLTEDEIVQHLKQNETLDEFGLLETKLLKDQIIETTINKRDVCSSKILFVFTNSYNAIFDSYTYIHRDPGENCPIAPKANVTSRNCPDDCHINFNVTDAQTSNSYLYVYKIKNVAIDEIEESIKEGTTKDVGLIQTILLKDDIINTTIKMEHLCSSPILFVFTNSYNGNIANYTYIPDYGLDNKCPKSHAISILMLFAVFVGIVSAIIIIIIIYNNNYNCIRRRIMDKNPPPKAHLRLQDNQTIQQSTTLLEHESDAIYNIYEV